MSDDPFLANKQVGMNANLAKEQAGMNENFVLDKDDQYVASGLLFYHHMNCGYVASCW